MKQALLAALALALTTPAGFASSVVGSPNLRHHAVAAPERHAEQFNLDGVECFSKPFVVKSTQGKTVAGDSVDCQE